MLYGQWDEMDRGTKGGSWKKLRGSLESSLPFLLSCLGLSRHRRIKLRERKPRERKPRERKLRKEEISELYYWASHAVLLSYDNGFECTLKKKKEKRKEKRRKKYIYKQRQILRMKVME